MVELSEFASILLLSVKKRSCLFLSTTFPVQLSRTTPCLEYPCVYAGKSWLQCWKDQTRNLRLVLSSVQILVGLSSFLNSSCFCQHSVYQMPCAQLLICVQLCHPMNLSLPGSAVHGDSSDKNTGVGCHVLFQGTSQPRDQPRSPALQADSLPSEPPGILKVKVGQSCLTQTCLTLYSNPINYIVHEILQARILQWGAFSFSRGSSQPRDRIQASCIAGRFFTI